MLHVLACYYRGRYATDIEAEIIKELLESQGVFARNGELTPGWAASELSWAWLENAQYPAYCGQVSPGDDDTESRVDLDDLVVAALSLLPGGQRREEDDPPDVKAAKQRLTQHCLNAKAAVDARPGSANLSATEYGREVLEECKCKRIEQAGDAGIQLGTGHLVLTTDAATRR